VLYRLQNRAVHSGFGREDVVTRRGHTRLAVHKVAEDRFLWRLEEFQERGAAGRGAESLSLPMLTANKAGVVLFTNEAMRRLLGGRPKRLDRIFTTPVLHSGEEVEVTSADGPVRAVLAEVEGPGERREI
jgi:two-component system, cell cycle sensor histidine kinase and response regulator CckA